MKIVGWCTCCHKVRYVTVTNQALVTSVATRQIVRGVCATCEREERERAALRDLRR